MRDRTAPTTRPRHGRDRGVSIVEVVLAISLTALVALPVMTTVRTSLRAAATNEEAAIAETALVDAADRINRAPQSCDYTIYAQASVQTRGWTATQAAVSHEHYDTVTDTWQPGGCQHATPTPDLVQRLVITVSTPNYGISRSLEVVKSIV